MFDSVDDANTMEDSPGAGLLVHWTGSLHDKSQSIPQLASKIRRSTGCEVRSLSNTVLDFRFGTHHASFGSSAHAQSSHEYSLFVFLDAHFRSLTAVVHDSPEVARKRQNGAAGPLADEVAERETGTHCKLSS